MMSNLVIVRVPEYILKGPAVQNQFSGEVWERELFKDLKEAAKSIIEGEPAYVALPNKVNPDTRQTEWDIKVVQF
ncbi:hypothetical protein BN405_2-10_Ab1_orf_104 [Pseudomonas phage vB_PaeM_C2-10_Ab1]|uniref:Uncharacterized protein n=5 Tax=Pakpunavirus TaxID=1921407 RepID=K4RM57_9CAUD|nr:hypothetical protein BN405_2-10_Ab1_orf_104 [Pseudomonas phage vB_PaeM_C2-10_Ab1]YP_010763101.1 hypothetical protein QE328_gp111 [Pseudomonas phage vB_PaM_EPA1]YP_010765175.1 hypothetical protein QE347_gp067 [Pseudomonas phage vB_Paer_Ps12]UOL47711.1 hypothetical protein vBPaerPs25_67 [Pseudomonas phage vB_Paer_Ps25]CEF89424.1 hypothetical protein [Pseudomonas phage vB_PaeM_C2-10_Ab08]QDF15587.1 hypothetical protein EPA1_109 [Pseudomonas phage vB_PaM_EPA1]UOL47523.1 hypothetical protein vB